MALTLWYHPFSSFCMKAVIALYECGAPFDPVIVDLGDPASRDAFIAVWPLGKFPVVRDAARSEVIPESTMIIEYLADRYPGAGLIPADRDSAREVRLWDRLFDNYIHVQMQRIVADRLRPTGSRDPRGVADARTQLRQTYDLLESRLAGREWAAASGFTMADCAAAPALHYAWMVEPWTGRPALSAYLDRLRLRPSIARVLAEAEPYAHFFPQE